MLVMGGRLVINTITCELIRYDGQQRFLFLGNFPYKQLEKSFILLENDMKCIFNELSPPFLFAYDSIWLCKKYGNIWKTFHDTFLLETSEIVKLFWTYNVIKTFLLLFTTAFFTSSPCIKNVTNSWVSTSNRPDNFENFCGLDARLQLRVLGFLWR